MSTAVEVGRFAPAVNAPRWDVFVRPYSRVGADTLSQAERSTEIVRDASSDYLPGRLLDAAARLRALAGLAPNWDTYGAQEIDLSVAKAALSVAGSLILRGVGPPFFTPGSDGSIQMEWRRGPVYAEVRVTREGRTEVFAEDLDSHFEQEVDFDGPHLSPETQHWLAALLAGRR